MTVVSMAALLLLVLLCGVSLASGATQTLSWRIASSVNVSANGAAVSTVGFDDSGWYSVNGTAATVVAALVGNGVYTDPFYGENFSAINSSDFDVPWWYRAQFTVPNGATAALLTFTGVSYKANVWLNGELLASTDDVAGTFRYYDFVLSSSVPAGTTAAVALQVYRPYDNVRSVPCCVSRRSQLPDDCVCCIVCFLV